MSNEKTSPDDDDAELKQRPSEDDDDDVLDADNNNSCHFEGWQNHDSEDEISAVATASNPPARKSAQDRTSSSQQPTQPPPPRYDHPTYNLTPSSFRSNSQTKRSVAWDVNVRSSLNTIGSSFTGGCESSVDLFSDDNDSDFNRSGDSLSCNNWNNDRGDSDNKKRGDDARTIQGIGSYGVGPSNNNNNSFLNSTNSLVVSFSKLNENELTHLRKWNRRLHRTEVFDKYYFPAKWETMEMTSLIRFLNLVDPSNSSSGNNISPSVSGSSGMGSTGGGSTRRAGGRRGLSRSVAGGGGQGHGGLRDSGGKKGLMNGLSSSFTSSLKETSSNFAKLLTDPKQALDPIKATKEALEFLFFPYVHDPKSVLLKRGSIFLLNNSNHNSSITTHGTNNNSHGANDNNSTSIDLTHERELMLFTHGFLVADLVLEDIFRLFLALSDREFLTEKSLLDYLRGKLKEMDNDRSGELDKWELYQVFHDMGIPKCESVLDELMLRNNISYNEHTQKVRWEELYKALQGIFSSPSSRSIAGVNSSPSSSFNLGGGEGSTRHHDSGCGGGGLKKLFGAFQKGDNAKKISKVESASLFSSVTRIDSLNICNGGDPLSKEIANSTLAHVSFAVTLIERKEDPLIFVCSNPDYRDSWVDSFRTCVVRALERSPEYEISELRNTLGWQHLVIRSTYTTLAIIDDLEALTRVLHDNAVVGTRHRKHKFELNVLDEYNGYSALHYATILGHTRCMDILLRSGAKVMLEDRDGHSPMYHALSQRNDEAANVLEKYGADRSHDLKAVIENEMKNDSLVSLESEKEGRRSTRAFMEETTRALNTFGTVNNCDDVDELLLRAHQEGHRISMHNAHFHLIACFFKTMGFPIPWSSNMKEGTISLDMRTNYLQKTPFFALLTRDTIRDFAKCFPKTLSARPGKNIELESNKIYVVAEGEVDLSTSYPMEGSKVEARGYLCRKRQGDVVNIRQTKQDVERRMTISRKLKDFAEEIITVGFGDKDILLLCGDTDALDEFNKTHPELSEPIDAICNSQIEDRLLSVPFLENVAKSKLSVLAAMCRYEVFETGQIVFEENSEATKLFLVLSGVAQVVAKSSSASASSPSLHPSSISASSRALSERSVTLRRSLECSGDRKTLVGTDEVIIAELKSGDYFGETALVFDIDRTCCVRTSEKSLFLTVHKTDFENFLKICPIEESLKVVIKRRMVSKLSYLGIPFLAGITGEMLSTLAASVVINEVPANHVIFRQGDIGDKFYIVVHGSVKLETAAPKDEESTSGGSNNDVHEHGIKDSNTVDRNLGTLGPGQYFGEMALVVGQGLRSATVTSTQKSILLSIDKDSFQNIFGSNHQFLAEFELRVLKQSAKLKHVLAHPLGVASFRNYLEKEHAGENIDFWLSVGAFIEEINGKNWESASNAECFDKAKKIFITFCAEYADRQVNLPHKMLAEVETRINSGEDITPDIFKASRDEIFKLMERDSFGRYKASGDFVDFFSQMGIL